MGTSPAFADRMGPVVSGLEVIVRYKVVDANSVAQLEEKVNAAMSDGYAPLGGGQVVYVTWENGLRGYSESEITFYQAMVADR